MNNISDPTIVCPKCHTEIRLTETLAAPILAEAKKSFESELAKREAELQKQLQENHERSEAIQKREAQLDAEIEARLESARAGIAEAEAMKMKLAFDETIRANKEQIDVLERAVSERNEKLAEVRKREQEARQKVEALKQREQELDAEVEARLREERAAISKVEARKAQLALDNQLKSRDEQIKELENAVAERNKSLADARNAEAELKRKERRLEQQKAELELSVETRVSEAISKLREGATKEAEQRFVLKITEKEEAIKSMRLQIEELKRKAEQGSQQLQGEAQEIELEAVLRAKFPTDIIRSVAKGVAGADVIQTVLGVNGQTCGTIIWESKRTKSWSDGWLSKLRADQRSSGADAAVLVSEALPKGLETFDLVSGVWVAEFRCVIPIATALRHALIEVSATRKAEEGQKTKMQMVYGYLTGPRFKQRVSAIVERFEEMQEDLDRERRTTQRLWAKREAQIQCVVEATSGMYGDLQGIAGRSLQEIDGLVIKLPPEPRRLKG